MSDSTQETAVKISGDGSGAVEAMKAASNAVTGGVEAMKSGLGSLGEAFGKVQGYFAALVAVVAGGKFFKEAISESNKLTGETMRLARTLGISAEEATTLNTALGDIYSDSDTYVGAFQKFTMQLRRNEDGLNAMGLSTRDASGHLRNGNEVFKEAISIVGQYKPGLDQTAAAQKLFGKSIDDVMKLQKLNNDVLDEAKRKNEELGLVITDQNVQASKEYKAAMNDVGDVMTAIMKVIGDAVMPVFTELANYLASTGPYVISVFKGALTGLMLVFRSLQAVVKTVASVIFEFINATMDQLSTLGELIGAVLSGDFDKAGQAAVRLKDRAVEAFRNIKNAAVEAFSQSGESFKNDFERLWGDKVAAKTPQAKGNKQMGDLKEDKGDKSRFAEWEAALQERKIAYQKENDLREMSKEDELKYWASIAAMADVNTKEKVQLRKVQAATELEILKEQRSNELALSEESIAAYKAARLAEVDAKRQESQFLVDTGRMTNQEMLVLDQELEQQRYQITKDAVTARLELLSKDPTKNVVALQKLNDELAQVELEHANKMRGAQLAVQKEQLKDWNSFFQSIGSAFGSVTQQLVNRTVTWGQAVQNLFKGLMSSVANFLAQIIAKKVAAWATEKAMNMGIIASNAGVAGSGAAASVAEIPFVGPVLALAAMAAVFGAVLGLQSKSARGGYDIPSGINPVVQTHEEEMILPAEQANAVRDMASGGGGTVIINTTGGDFIHKDDLGRLMKQLGKKFVFK